MEQIYLLGNRGKELPRVGGGGSLGEKTSAAPCPRALIDLRMEG